MVPASASYAVHTDASKARTYVVLLLVVVDGCSNHEPDYLV